jgi:hypothetical protein
VAGIAQRNGAHEFVSDRCWRGEIGVCDVVFSQHRHDATAFLPPFCPTPVVQNTQLPAGRGLVMWGSFSLSRVVVRVLEIAGAGLTSALVAYLLGRTDPPPQPPAPQVPAVVHLAPTDEEMIRSVRNDQAALFEQLRNQAQKAQTSLEAPVADNQPPNAAAKPAKAAQSNTAAQSGVQATVRREAKPEHVRPAEAKPRLEAKVEPRQSEQRGEQRVEELLQSRAANGNAANGNAANNSAYVPAAAPAPAPVAQAPAENEPGLLTQTFRRVTAWLLPSRDRMPMPDASAARPPMPVREFQSNAM